MDVLIRNVDPKIIKEIDSLARRKRISRNEFLKEQLEVISVIDLIVEKQKLVDKATRNVNGMLMENSNQLDKMEKNYEKMVHLISLATEIDLDVMNEIVEETKKKFN